jgi:hypothetical protein
MERSRMMRRGRVPLGLLVLVLVGAAPAAADPCGEWLDEHREWKAEVVHRYLTDASQRELDEAVFELIQREAYLTSCPAPVAVQRDQMVGWRLVERDGDEFASAVVASVLELGGFDLELRHLFDGGTVRAARREP